MDLHLGFLGRNGLPFPLLTRISLTKSLLRTLRRGKHRLFIWRGVEADGSVDTSTPSKLGVRDEMGRLEKASAFRLPRPYSYLLSQLVKKYERGDLPKSDWLDKLTFRKMEEVHAVLRQLHRLYLYPYFVKITGGNRKIRESLPIHRPTPI